MYFGGYNGAYFGAWHGSLDDGFEILGGSLSHHSRHEQKKRRDAEQKVLLEQLEKIEALQAKAEKLQAEERVLEAADVELTQLTELRREMALLNAVIAEAIARYRELQEQLRIFRNQQALLVLMMANPLIRVTIH